MIKYYLKNSDKKSEVKIGDTLNVSVPADTPYGKAECSINVVVTQSSLAQLIKDGLVVAIDSFSREDYKPFVEKLASKHGISFKDALELLDNIKHVSIYAHNEILLEMMSEVFNKNKVKSPDGMSYIVDHRCNVKGVVYSRTPVFFSEKDALKAAKLVKQFCNEC